MLANLDWADRTAFSDRASSLAGADYNYNYSCLWGRPLLRALQMGDK